MASILLILCVSVLFLLHENQIHIHADPDYGTCPECGQARTGAYITGGPTCTEGDSYEFWCNNPSCSLYLSAEGGYTPALGHDYVGETVREATCTQSGLIHYNCKRCGDSPYDKTVAALGHSYDSSVTKSATCTESGIRTYSCIRCGDTYTETIKALGHNYTYEETEATCTEDGHKIGTCSRCGNVTDEVSPALGHDMSEAVVVKEASCEEDGLKETECQRCGEKASEVIPKTGHKYPEEWTIEKEAGLLTKGLKCKICEYCGNRIEEVIPALVSPSVLLGGGRTLILLGAGLFFGWKHKKKIVEEVVEKKKFKPSIENKTIVIDSADEKFIKLLKAQSHLKVAVVDHEESTLSETVEEKEPNLIICDALTKEALNELIETKKEAFPDTPLALIPDDKTLKGSAKQLKQLKEDKAILDYLPSGTSPYQMMVRFVLPILKPELDSDETLDNIGQITDLLGIPGISTAINFYVSGRDIKATLEEGELGVVEGATIIGDVASIMGWDQVGDIAGLVNDVDAIKTAFKKGGGAYERKKGVKAAKDISEVVGDLTD
ncbi:MAG: hypothetical protein IJL85_07145 [Erysipelotrichaceae bacterium]|nr:hypothetical protein [Erysipelotrichaceae bacterium]